MKKKVAATSAVKRKARLRHVNRQQMLMRVVDVELLIPEEHPARAIWELVGQLDLSRFHEGIKSVEGRAGREAFDPRVLTSMWIYGYSQGENSARRMARLCVYDPVYQWLTGMDEINHHTLSNFRVQHGEELREMFVQVLGVLSSEGLISLKRVTQDGTRIKAKASGKSFQKGNKLREHLEWAREQVEELEQMGEEELEAGRSRAQERAARERVERLEKALTELEKIKEGKKKAKEKAEARASESDPEARIMKHADGSYSPSYNVQLGVDTAEKIIVGVGISQSAADQGELLGGVERMEENLGSAPGTVLADGAYTTLENVMEMEERGVELVGPKIDREERRKQGLEQTKMSPAFYPSAFKYEEGRNLYRCPEGKELKYLKKRKRPGSTTFLYRTKGAECQSCKCMTECCPDTAEKGRVVRRIVDAPEITAFNKKMESAEAKAIYKERSQVAEFPHAWIKDKLGLRQFRSTGVRKVEMEAVWACLTYNIQQWIRLVWKPRLALTT